MGINKNIKYAFTYVYPTHYGRVCTVKKIANKSFCLYIGIMSLLHFSGHISLQQAVTALSILLRSL